MNGAKHRFSLILTCLLLTGLTVVYPFLLYTDNAFVTKWREWYIETAMGTMTHQWLATSFIPHDMIEKVMAKRYLMNQKQAGAESFWDFTLDTDGEEQAISPKARFYKLYSELDETEFESFLDENPDIKEQGYEGFEFDFIDDATTKGYDTGLKTRQGDPVLALDVKHGILIVEQTGEDALGLEYAGKLALCKKPENVYVGTCEGLGDYGSYVSEIVSRYDAVLGITTRATARAVCHTASSRARAPRYRARSEMAGRSSASTRAIIFRSVSSRTRAGYATRSSSIRRSSSTARILWPVRA